MGIGIGRGRGSGAGTESGAFRSRWRLIAASVAMVAVGLACGGDDPAKPKDPVQIPDFTLLDTNPHSPTYLGNVSLSDFAGKSVVIFFGEEYCTSCRAQMQLLSDLIDSLATEGITDVAGMMINQHGPAGVSAEVAAQFFGSWETDLPLLHDTRDPQNGWDVVGHLIECENFNDLLIVDHERYSWKKTSLGDDKALDLTIAADFTKLRGWLRELDAEQ